MIRGHFHYCVHQVLGCKPIYITMLRDPLARTISRYLHFKRDTAHYLYERAHNMTLAEFIHDPLTRAQIQNLQTRHIAWDFDLRGMVAASPTGILQPFYLEERINGMLAELSPESDTALLEIAKQRLIEFAWVGLVERFADSMALLTYTFCWQPLREYEARNVAPESLHRETIEPAILAEIKELTWADQQLYNFGKQLFEERFASMLLNLLETDYGLEASRQSTPANDYNPLRHLPVVGPTLRTLKRLMWTGRA